MFNILALVRAIANSFLSLLGRQLITAMVVGVLTFSGVIAVYANVNNVAVKQDTTEGKEGPVITNTSGPAEIALAQHLKSSGARMFSSFTCPHCYQQKQLFGQEAFNSMTHVECNPEGKNSQTQLCIDAGITGVPTWEIGGEFYPGVQPMEKLAELSGYQGDVNFIHPFPY